MRISVVRPPDFKTEIVEGQAALDVVREVFREITKGILIEEMPFTGKVRCRAKELLRSGQPIWTHWDDVGQCDTDKSTIIKVLPKIVGIIKKDGTYEPVGDGPKENPFAGKDQEKPGDTGAEPDGGVVQGDR